jgi:hypothetical protein
LWLAVTRPILKPNFLSSARHGRNIYQAVACFGAVPKIAHTLKADCILSFGQPVDAGKLACVYATAPRFSATSYADESRRNLIFKEVLCTKPE